MIKEVKGKDLKDFYERVVKSADIATEKCKDPDYISTHK